MDSNHRSGTKEPVFLAEGELRDRAWAAKNGCFFMRYRWFESISLQRGVLVGAYLRINYNVFKGLCVSA